jgi:hypothetical protein
MEESMKTLTAKRFLAAGLFVVLAFFFAACPSPTSGSGPDDPVQPPWEEPGPGPNEEPEPGPEPGPGGPPWTVVFNANGGTPISSQTVGNASRAARPIIEPAKAGSIFDDWYTDDSLTELYDFDSPVRSDITIYAAWEEIPAMEGLFLNKSLHPNGDKTPINLLVLTGSNTIEKAINYVKAHAEDGPYTLVLRGNYSGSGYELVTPKARLTIVGGSGGAVISLNSSSVPLFTVGDPSNNRPSGWIPQTNNISLTLDNGIKITGNGSSSVSLIKVTDGAALLLRGNAEITGHTTSAKEGAVNVNGVYPTSFTMGGGKIYNNITTAAGSDGAGGVYVYNVASFTMAAGEISGNLKSTSDPGDVYIHCNSTFTLVPEAPYIEALTLGAGTESNYAPIIIGGALSAPSATGAGGKNIKRIDLYDSYKVVSGVEQSCKGMVIFEGANYQLVSGDFDKFGLGSFIGTDTSTGIASTYAVFTGSGFFGKLMPVSTGTGPVAIGDIHFPTLAEAVYNAPNGTAETPTVITVETDVNVDARITISEDKHIKLVSGDNALKTITLTSTGTAPTTDPEAKALFSIVTTSSLTLGADIKLTADAAKTGALVSLPVTTRWPNAKFIMETGSEISGFSTSSQYGAVKVLGGTFLMKGGTITNNVSSSTTNGAAAGVYVGQNDFNGTSPSNPGGTFIMTGGSITVNSLSGNNNTDSKAGVYVEGTGIRAGQFINEGGGITGNTRTPTSGDTTPVASNYTGD